MVFFSICYFVRIKVSGTFFIFYKKLADKFMRVNQIKDDEKGKELMKQFFLKTKNADAAFVELWSHVFARLYFFYLFTEEDVPVDPPPPMPCR